MQQAPFEITTTVIGPTRALLRVAFPQADAHVTAWRQAQWLLAHERATDARWRAVLNHLQRSN